MLMRIEVCNLNDNLFGVCFTVYYLVIYVLSVSSFINIYFRKECGVSCNGQFVTCFFLGCESFDDFTDFHIRGLL